MRETLAVRKSSGTRTMSDLVRHPGGIIRGLRRQPFGAPADDRQALEAGDEIAVAATAFTEAKTRQGRLVLRVSPRSVVWQPYRPLRGYGHPVDLAGTRWGGDSDRSGPGAWKVKPVMRIIRLADEQQEHRFAVSAGDVDLIRRVVSAE
jgi:hypothetical protein